MKKNKVYLTDDQLTGLVKLIDDEIELNTVNGDDAYNTYWENIKMALGFAIVKWVYMRDSLDSLKLNVKWNGKQYIFSKEDLDNLEALIKKEKLALLTEIEKKVIGSDQPELTYMNGTVDVNGIKTADMYALQRNRLRATQRAELSRLKEQIWTLKNTHSIQRLSN